MKGGNTGVIGDRLRQARLASGLTLDEVVGRLATVGQSLTKAGLSKYETNKSTPNATTLLKLAQALGVRSTYFTQEPTVRVEWVAFRKHSQLPQSRQEHIKAYVSSVVESQLWLEQIFYPQFKRVFPQAWRALTVDDAEEAAERSRWDWHLAESPVESVTRTVEDHGAVVVAWDADEGKFDGLAGWANGTRPVVVFNRTVSTDRQRYNVAHEVGHMVLDCADLPEKDQEALAHRFAAAFLVPRDVARRELGAKRRHIDLTELGLLKRKYGLSMQGWARRAFDVGIIEAGYYKRLCIEFSRRGWRKREPYPFEGGEEPTRLKQMTFRAVAEGIITKDRATQLCPRCFERSLSPPESEGKVYLTAVELMRLPRKERERILAVAAAEAEVEYRADPDLTDLDVIGEDDWYDETP